MVGGLIKQQYVGPAIGDQCQRQSRFFATAEGVDDFKRTVAGEIPFAEEITQYLIGRIRIELAQVIQRRGAGHQ